jgi:hypothetical protein
MRVAGDKEGGGGKVMAMATRVAGKRTATAMKRSMAMKTREVGNEEGNRNGGKSNSNGKEEADGFHPSIFDSYVNQVQSFVLYIHRKTSRTI